MEQLFSREKVSQIINDVVSFISYNNNPDITGEDFMDMYYPEQDPNDFTYAEEK